MSSPNATPHDRSRENEPAPDNPLEDALWAALARVEDPGAAPSYHRTWHGGICPGSRRRRRPAAALMPR